MFHVKHEVSHTEISADALQKVNDLLSKNTDKLFEYATQLLWWNQKVNLVSRDVSRETVMEHIRHSLLISSTQVFGKASSVIDTGTGGGLPGIPLAICFPDKEFILNDIVSKKIMAVKQIGMKLGLKNVRTVSDSIAKLKVSNGDVIVTKHAFKIWELTGYLQQADWMSIIFLKGESEAGEELGEVKVEAKMTITNLDSVIKDEFYKGKAIVELSRLKHE